jgi:preprotein translocase subunit SecG
MTYPLLLSLHVLVCLLVILVVLVQSGKGAGFSSVFGGGSSDSLFNAPSGSMFIRKVTAGLAAAFFLSSLFLTYFGSRQRASSVTQSMPLPLPAAAPSQPAETAPTPAPAEAPKKK